MTQKGRNVRVEVATLFGTAKTVTAVSKANPGVASSAAHGLANASIGYFENVLGLGRTVGGINNTANHEVFIFSTSTNFKYKFSKDIPGGVYGLLMRPPLNFILTHAPMAEFQVWNSTLSTKIFQKSLGSSPVAMSCDGNSIFFYY
jgi:hypothetical protein